MTKKNSVVSLKQKELVKIATSVRSVQFSCS